MIQQPLPFNTRNLFELITNVKTLETAFESVRRNNGSPGVDNISVSDFDKVKSLELAALSEDLQKWRYKPLPVRRVEIPKPGKDAGVRLLGIPAVRDRIVQAAIKAVLEPIFDPLFSDRSFGFRPNCSQHQAIEAARQEMFAGKEYVVDIDLSKFFDRINQDKLIASMSKVISDKRVLRIIGLTLRSGVMTHQGFEPTTIGSVQGSPLSPLLSNIVLDELDKKLEQRGLSFVRFADDCNIFVNTAIAATRVMENITHFIEKKMKLVINRDKSKIGLSRKIKFLGVNIIKGTVAIAKSSMKNARVKIKELIPRGTNKTLEQTMQELNVWFRGWSGYFAITHYPAQFKSLEAFARRRLRSRIVSQSKRRIFLFRKLMRHGIKHKTAAKCVFSNKGRWALSKSKAVEMAFSNKYFKQAGQYIKSTQKLRHWFDVNKWVHLS